MQATRIPAGTSLLLATLVIALSGCSLVPTTRETPQPTVAAAPSAERLAAQGNHKGAAEAYEKLAERGGPNRDALLTKAVREWVAAGEPLQARRVYGLLGTAAAGAARIERAVLAAEVGTAAGAPDQALKDLRALEPLPAGQEAAILAARGRAEFALGRTSDGIRSFIAREHYLEPGAIAANQRQLWEALRAAAARGASLKPPKNAEPVLLGWLELARVGVQGSRNPFALSTAVADWRKRFPTHPANLPARSSVVDSIVSDTVTRLDYPSQIALLLPLSGRNEAAGQAVRDGFMAGFYAQDAGTRPQVRIYDVGSDPAGVYNQAVNEGASLVVGPLTKEDVIAVARVGNERVTTLALNNLPVGEVAPLRFYQFALAPEDEAEQVARRLLAEGRTSGIALVPQGEWGTRVLTAFNTTLTAGGGRLLNTRAFAPNTTDYSDAIVALLGFEESKARHRRLVQTLGMSLEFSPRRRSDVQFVFVGAQPTQGRLIRPQLKFHYAGDLPMYATSDIYDNNPAANLDLDDVMFPQMPWLATPDAGIVDVREEVRALWPDRERRRGRLYAMGFDAYRLVAELGSATNPLREPITGMTGRLALGADRQIHRTLEWVQLQGGQLRSLPPIADAL